MMSSGKSGHGTLECVKENVTPTSNVCHIPKGHVALFLQHILCNFRVKLLYFISLEKALEFTSINVE